MLSLDTDKRITADQTLSHPYLSQYADPSDEPSSPPYDQTFEDYDIPVEEWKGNLTRIPNINIYKSTAYLFQRMFGMS